MSAPLTPVPRYEPSCAIVILVCGHIMWARTDAPLAPDTAGMRAAIRSQWMVRCNTCGDHTCIHNVLVQP